MVPGYVALYLTQPVNIALTFAAAFLTYAIVRGLSNFLIVFGKRRTVLMLLVGFTVGAMFRMLLGRGWFGTEGLELTVIGYIVPALIAIWMDRQGWLDTCTTTLTAAVVVRLALVLIVPQELHLAETKRQAEAQMLNGSRGDRRGLKPNRPPRGRRLNKAESREPRAESQSETLFHRFWLVSGKALPPVCRVPPTGG